jgi:hypothetical protein
MRAPLGRVEASKHAPHAGNSLGVDNWIDTEQ